MGWLLKSLNNTSDDAFAAQDVNSASFKQGLTPEYVRKLTQFLKDNGYDQEVTDTYDDAVKSNLIQFQSDHYNSNAENYAKRKKMVNYVDIALNTNPLYNLAKLSPVVRTTIDYMAGRNPVVTEKDLNKNSQEFLGKVIANQLDSSYYDNQTFGPANYPNKRYHKNPLSSGFNVSYLVGRGNFEKDGDSYVITDNFDPGSNAGKHGFFGKIENAINAFTGKRDPIRTEIVIPEEMVETHQDGGIMKYQNPSETLPELIQRVNKKSKANFVKRLLDPNRKSIQDWVAPLNIATHKLGWATEDTKQGAFVYPEVQEINGELIDFTYPSHRRSEGINSAIERRDTVRMTPEQAKWFTENYKQYYPGFQNGGNLLTPHPLSPVGIALNQAKAMAKGKKDQQHLPPGVKEVVGPDGKKVAIRTEQPLVPLEQSIAEWLPGTGDVAEVGQITNDVKNGNLGSATLGAGLLFLPGNAGKLLKTNVGKKISNFLNKDLFNYDELWAKIKHPTWKKYAHGSDDPFFDIKNADMGYNGEVGIHMTDDIPIAEVFAKGYSGRPGKVYEFYAPKPTLETIDATDNAANIYIGNVERLAGGTFNSSNTNTFFENLLKKYGGEDVIQDIPVDNSYREDLNFMFPGTGDNLKKYTLKQDVIIPTKDEIWPNKPEHVKKQFEELGKRWNQFKIDKKDAAREVSKILSDNGHKVLKYENVQPREGLKTAYVLTDPSIIHLINPEHQFKVKHALTGLGTGLGIGYGASQLKDE